MTSGTPEATAATFGVEAILWSNSAALVEAVRSADLVIIGGGGIFHDYWGFNPGALLTDDHSGISFYTGPALLAAMAGKPVMLYAIGVGPLVSDAARQFTRTACDAAEVVTVRDEGSLELLRALGVSKAQLTADPVFDFSIAASIDRRPRLGIVLRAWDVGVAAAQWEKEAATALDLFLDEHPVEAAFLPFQRLAGSKLEDDAAVARRVQQLMRHQDRTSILADGPVAEEIAACEIVLGMRLHASILAAVTGVPMVALSYDAKVEQMMKRLELQPYTVDIQSFDAALLAAKLTEVYAGRKEIQAHLKARVPALSTAARSNAELAMALLNEGRKVCPAPHVAALAGETLQRHIGKLNRQRQENRHLFAEFEFYRKHSEELAAANARVHAAMERQERQERQLAESLRQMEDRERRLEAQLDQAHRKYQETANELREAEELRARVLRGLDQFQRTLDSNLANYRSQRVWTVMLWIRKAYWLIANRGLGSFVRWFLSGSPGLEDLELTFPQVWHYMPERLEIPVRGAGPPAETEAVELTTWLPKQTYDVIILAIFDFEFRFQRPQQIAAELARRGHRVFWVSPARVLAENGVEPYEAIPLRENLWEIHLRGQRPELYTGSEPPDERLADSLRSLYRDFAIAESCAMLQFPHWRRIGLALREEFGSRLVYDCMDDWQNWTAEPRISDFNLAEERQLAREADVLVVTSQEFKERQEAAGLKPVLARNAADFDFFASPRPNDLLGDVKRPIVGYYGAIADWFDLDLITYVAESRPQYSFVLIGGVHKVDVSRPRDLGNVHLYGEKNYREIPLFLSHFDVALIPFVLNKLTKGVDPVKMYEYFSQGKPVVATDMAELTHSTHLLYIGRTKEEFLAHIDQALKEDDPKLGKARIDYAKANTWGVRVDAIDTAVRAVFPRISVLIVTYNSEEFIGPCLDSVLKNTAAPGLEVIVVDNASTDRTREILERYPEVRAFPESRNLGFAGGNNLAAREATGDYLVFLNADTIVPPGWLERLWRPCYRDATVGAVAAVTNFSGNETKINVDYHGVAEMLDFARKLATEKAGVTMDIPMAPLYCVLVPRKVWEAVGELDTSFGVGMFEDDDFSLRMRTAGYRVISAEDAFIHHFGNGSFGKLPSQDSLRIFHENQKRYEAKWGVEWKKHSLRPGVRPPFEELRLGPAEFMAARAGTNRRGALPPELKGLHPASSRAGVPFNVQRDGQAALVIDCERATPLTVITWNDVLLQTAYGTTRMLSAIVPAELFREPGVYAIRLVNDFGVSNPLEFEVIGKKVAGT